MKELVGIIAKYNTPDLKKSIWQIINSLVPYVVLWYLMYLSLGISYWITLALALIAAGFLVRLFIIFHDCGHGSFFRSGRANRIAGTLLGTLAFTSFRYWTNDHAIHHRTVGNLDKRGHGDVWTLTTGEYRDLPERKRFFYRLYRHPLMLFMIGPFFLFVIWFRFPRNTMTAPERNGVYLTNLILAVYITGILLLVGWKAFLLIQLPVVYFATLTGVWLFYVQHQFEGVIWSRQDEWSYRKMALQGSSFLKFPRLLQWFSGNIGYHHIHHLSPMIPNYNLERCHRENSVFKDIKPVTFIDSMRTLKLRLWDEENEKLISFRQFRQHEQRSTATIQ